jgi:hypothetical protein
MMTIDYEAQFKSLTEFEWIEVGREYPACRLFEVKAPRSRKAQARKAFKYAKEHEDQGFAVEFGEFAGDYYVWSE